MDFSWLAALPIAEILSELKKSIKYNSAHKDLLLRELQRNIKAYKIAKRYRNMNYDSLLELLHTTAFEKALEDKFPFSKVKRGKIEKHHVFDQRNLRYIGKSSAWMFKNIESKITELRDMKTHYGSLKNIENANIALHFTNLFYKMKLLADFIGKKD